MREWKSRTCMFCVRMHITSHRRIRFGKNTYPFWAVPKHATEIRLFGKKFSIRIKVHSILPPSEQHRPAKSYATSFGTFGHRVTLDFGRHFWKGMNFFNKNGIRISTAIEELCFCRRSQWSCWFFTIFGTAFIGKYRQCLCQSLIFYGQFSKPSEAERETETGRLLKRSS